MSWENELIIVDNKEKLEKLIREIKKNVKFYGRFRFGNSKYRNELLNELNISVEKCEKQQFIYDADKKFHISESIEENYILISTTGLIACNPNLRTDKDKIVWACNSQYKILELLLREVMQISCNNEVYRVDSYTYGWLSEITTGLVHNTIFYLELFLKSYIALNDEKYNKTHGLLKLVEDAKEVAKKQNHENTLFYFHILQQIEKFIEDFYLTTTDKVIEQFIKYNDSIQTSVVIDRIGELYLLFRDIEDFLFQLFYLGSVRTYYFKNIKN